MADGIAKGIGEQLGNLGKQIVVDIAKTPAKIIGIDETKGQGTGASSKQSGQKTKSQTGNPSDNFQENEIEKQKKIAEARKLLQQISQPSQTEQPIREKLEQEEMQKKQVQFMEQQKSAKQQLPAMSSKPKPGTSSRKNQQGIETKLNIKAQ